MGRIVSPRNRYVARVLTEACLGTLLFDLLTPEEEPDRANVFDIGLLARPALVSARVRAATGSPARPAAQRCLAWASGSGGLGRIGQAAATRPP